MCNFSKESTFFQSTEQLVVAFLDASLYEREPKHNYTNTLVLVREAPKATFESKYTKQCYWRKLWQAFANFFWLCRPLPVFVTTNFSRKQVTVNFASCLRRTLQKLLIAYRDAFISKTQVYK